MALDVMVLVTDAGRSPGRHLEFDTIDDVVRDIAKGRIVIVTDDADRENEGDLGDGGGEGDAGSDQFHGHAWPRLDLRAGLERARGATWACNAWWRRIAKCIAPTLPSQSMRRAV